MKNLKDLELLDLIREDKGAAFEELYNRHWKDLYNAAHKRLADEYRSEELVQETFVNLYLKKDTLVITSSLGAYMHTVLKYKVLDEVRKRLSSKAYLESLLHHPMADSADVHQLLERKEIKEQFAIFSETLPKKCKEVFLLKQEDLSNKKIAEVLQISEKTVEGHVSHARKLMKSFFVDYHLSTLIPVIFMLTH